MDIGEQVTKQVEKLFKCSSSGEYIRIETPFIYSDGDVIDLFFRKNSSSELITDLGQAIIRISSS